MGFRLVWQGYPIGLLDFDARLQDFIPGQGIIRLMGPV